MSEDDGNTSDSTMAPDPVLCSAPGCNHSFGSATGNALTSLIDLHGRTAHPPIVAAPPPIAGKPEKVKRPVIKAQGTTEDWTIFLIHWDEYKGATKITGANIVYQLLETCDEKLRTDLTRCYGSLAGETEHNLLNFIKTLAIRPENVMVARVKLQSYHQEREESVRSFVARLRGQAGVCNFSKSKRCQCAENVTVDYSDDMVRDALIRGLEDEDIRLHILGQANQDMTLEETLQLAEAQECGRRSAGRLLQSSDSQNTANAASAYRRQNNTRQQQRNNRPAQSQQLQQKQQQRNDQRNNQPSTNSPACSHCGQIGHGSGRNYRSRLKNCPAFNHQCTKCNMLHHFESSCLASQRTNQQLPASAANQDAVFEELNNAGFFDSAFSEQACAAYSS